MLGKVEGKEPWLQPVSVMTLPANSEENWMGTKIILVAGWPDQSKAEAHLEE